MNIVKSINAGIQFIAGGVLELFSPDHDNYPHIGVEPFQGDPYKPTKRFFNW
ncbi:MAG TPA: hypothetical protein V6D04_12295 [Candidatus Obscuribacterales bacterium]|jgi:hypothetical protein